MTLLSIDVPDAVHRALEHRAAREALPVDQLVLSILRPALGVAQTRTSDAPTAYSIPAGPLEDEALALAIRETSAFYEGG